MAPWWSSAVLAGCSRERPLAIYHEGFIGYLDDIEKQRLADIVKELLRDHEGAWITPDPALATERRESIARILPAWGRLQKRAEDMTKQKYEEYGFPSEAAADAFFERNGFIIEKLDQPTELYSFDRCAVSSEDRMHLMENIRHGGKVWVLRPMR